MWYVSLLLLVCCSYYTQAYKAAVIQYYPYLENTPENTILKNIQEYKKYVNRAKEKGADIIVFPEYGLVTVSAVYNPQQYAVEVPNSTVVKQLSDIARHKQIYLVVNLFEKNEEKIYNTNLVFDRNGTIVIKYHKIHLYNERHLSPGSTQQKSVFTTDFGTTFGIFTCFDILFVNPSKTVLEGTNVTDVIFVTGWIPSFITPTIEQGFSASNRINLLASNYGQDYYARSGTGIYHGDGSPGRIVTTSSKTKLIVREIPAVPKSKEICPAVSKSPVKRISTTRKYYYHEVDLKHKHSGVELCSRNFCCTFRVTVNPQTWWQIFSDVYKFMIFDDEVYYKHLKAGIRICSLLVCQTKHSTESCGSTISTSTAFKKISIHANFVKKNSTFSRPITLRRHSSLIRRIKYCEEDDSVTLSTKKQKDVQIFGIFQRQDVEDPIEEVNEVLSASSFPMIFWGRSN